VALFIVVAELSEVWDEMAVLEEDLLAACFLGLVCLEVTTFAAQFLTVPETFWVLELTLRL
jgi:hypothetical protein